MPYDLFISRMSTGVSTAWEFVSTYAKLHEAQDAITYQGCGQPELRRWALFYIRRTTGHTGQLHSQGDYPQKETTHD